jgi:pyruvate/2-oxoglutarate dehydrogenase complex dihydrolipoamide dehydrogenase (E3) component
MSIAKRLGDMYRAHGVKIELQQLADVISTTEDGRIQVQTQQGARFIADQVVVSVGVRPNTTLLRDKVEMTDVGAVVVDRYMYTTNNKIMAVGDSTDSYFTPTLSEEYITQVSGAIREGNIAGMNIFERWVQAPGSQATYGLKLFEMYLFRTGATERNLAAHNIPVASTEVTQTIRPDWVDDTSEVTIKLVYNKETQVVLGVQLIANQDIHDIITSFSLLINKQITLTELAFGDVFFEPHFNNPINLINNAALTAIDQINAADPANSRI